MPHEEGMCQNFVFMKFIDHIKDNNLISQPVADLLVVSAEIARAFMVLAFEESDEPDFIDMAPPDEEPYGREVIGIYYSNVREITRSFVWASGASTEDKRRADTRLNTWILKPERRW